MDNEQNEKRPLSRRNFLKGFVISAASIPVVAAGCTPMPPEQTTASNAGYHPSPPPPLNPDVPLASEIPTNPAVLRTFTLHEARTVEALTARIMPGTPADPGAREAGVVNYIDSLLTYHEGFTESTYREPPFAQVYEGDTPPEDDTVFETVWIPSEEIKRYGVQSILSPREVYRLGIAAVDTYARSKHDTRFIELSEDEQDGIIEDMVNGNAQQGFDQISSKQFFTVLRRHTAEGMFSDPAYGGNRNMVGWQLIGYPGAQRAYTENDIRRQDGYVRPPQALAQLHSYSPGEHAGDHVVLPVSGSQEEYPVFNEHP